MGMASTFGESIFSNFIGTNDDLISLTTSSSSWDYRDPNFVMERVDHLERGEGLKAG